MCCGHDGTTYLSLFSRPSNHLLDALAAEGRVRAFRAGQAIWWEGDSGSEVLILQSGRLRSTRASLDGNEATLAVIEPVTVLGVPAIFGGGPHDSTLIALRNSTVLIVPHWAVLATMRNNPAIADELLHGLVTELRRANERHVRMINCDVRQRLLLWLSERAFNDADPRARTGARVVIDRTQGELADELWTTRSTLNRVIHELEQTGVIRLDGDVIVLLKSHSPDVPRPHERQPARLPIAPGRDSTRSATR